MGEIADMMLDGILDANGEYTGRNYGYPVYPKGWFGKRNSNPIAGISCFIQGGKYAQRISKKAVRKILLQYAEIINFPPIGDHQTGEDWDNKIAQVITKDFNSFKQWYNKLEKIN